MTGTLTYDLPDEEAQFKAAASAMDWVETVRELDNWLRNEGKHDDLKQEYRYAHPNDALQSCRDKMFEILKENGLFLYE
jgi:hypothetical protein